MGLYFLIFFAAGYWTAGLVIYVDRMVFRRLRPTSNRRMLKLAFLDLMMALIVLIVKFGGRQL